MATGAPAAADARNPYVCRLIAALVTPRAAARQVLEDAHSSSPRVHAPQSLRSRAAAFTVPTDEDPDERGDSAKREPAPLVLLAHAQRECGANRRPAAPPARHCAGRTSSTVGSFAAQVSTPHQRERALDRKAKRP
jgi:hypothetical protein